MVLAITAMSRARRVSHPRSTRSRGCQSDATPDSPVRRRSLAPATLYESDNPTCGHRTARSSTVSAPMFDSARHPAHSRRRRPLWPIDRERVLRQCLVFRPGHARSASDKRQPCRSGFTQRNLCPNNLARGRIGSGFIGVVGAIRREIGPNSHRRIAVANLGIGLDLHGSSRRRPASRRRACWWATTLATRAP